MAEDLLGYDRLQLATIVELGRKGVKTLEDLADLAADEMVELVPEAGLGDDDAGAIIMDARVRLGWIEAPEPEAEAEREPSWRRRSSADAMIEHVDEDVTGRAGRRARARAPRRCVATRAPRPAEALIRFVRRPGCRPWCRTSPAACPAVACGSAPTARCWRGPWPATSLPRRRGRRSGARRSGRPGQAMLVRRCLDLVGLARRAGELVAGFDQVADWLRHGRCGLVLARRDGCRRRAPPDRGPGRRRAGARPVRPCELGGAVGRDEVGPRRPRPSAASPASCSTSSGRLHGFREFRMPVGHVVRNAVDKGAARP